MGKHERTLAAIFADPVQANISWSDAESLLRNLGAEVSQGKGSRVRVVLNGIRAVIHRPHPRKEINKLTVKSIRRLFVEAGVKP